MLFSPCQSIDDLVDPKQKLIRYCKTEQSGDPAIENQDKPHRLFDWQISGLCTPEYPVHVCRRTSKEVSVVVPITHKAAGEYAFPIGNEGRHSVFQEQLSQALRRVFGPTLRVEVNDSLQLVNRTVDGITVALDQLSTGAREQMGMLVRLAAASMVSKEGGVPLVLDDALGSTDEGRTQAMGTVLRIASQDLQTIILTCSPERYVHVGALVSVAL